MLDFIKDKLKSRISSWFARSLSLGGKEVLLKAMAMAMPVYAMSYFKLAKSSCEALSSDMADFWWNSTRDRRKIHWISWEKLCLSKQDGGLGFWDIEYFNQALMAKQAWRIVQDPFSLCARFLKSRYFDQEKFLCSIPGTRPSFAWRSILHGRDLLMKGLQKNIGNRRSICVWSEP